MTKVLCMLSYVTEVEYELPFGHGPENGKFSEQSLGNRHLKSFMATLRPKIGSTSKGKSVLDTHPTSVYTKFEMDWVNSFF